jgi:PAS domain S-box-containing protein
MYEGPIDYAAAPSRPIEPSSCEAEVIGITVAGKEMTEHRRAKAKLTPNERRLRDPNNALAERIEARAQERDRITTQHRQLEERETKIRRLVDISIIGIVICDLDGQILGANDAFLHMMGYDPEDLAPGRLRWTDLTPPEWRGRDAEAVEELKRTGTMQPFEKEYFRKDGSRVPVLIGGVSFEEGGQEGVAFVLDLTERKRAEAEARNSERRYREVQTELAHVSRVATMGQLTASIAHEVNQPLASVAANAEACLLWLDREAPNLDAARRSVEWIIKDCNRAGEVIRHVRALSKKADAQKAPVDINDVINEVISLVQRELNSHRVSLQTQLSTPLPLILADRVQLQQVVLNLIINAVEAMSGASNGTRELLISSGGAEPSGILVAVRDSGPGLAPATLEHLFDAFYTTKTGGMGMGLSICRSIIEAYGGRLWATANEPRGAVFLFTLTP